MKKYKKRKNMVTSATVAVADGAVANQTAVKTAAFNSECDGYRSSLRAEEAHNLEQLQEKLKVNPSDDSMRSKTVDITWKYEQADVKMGGRGSVNLNSAERTEVATTGKLSGAEVHHINSVAEHPELQTSASNGRIYRSKSEHLREGHQGDFRNASSGELIDRDAMLKYTNHKRVIKNEAKGASVAVVLGVATGVASSVVATCKEEGVSFKSVKKGVKQSGKPAFISATTSLLTYGLTRGVKYFFK